ncbi:MAG: O-antigen ligase family protein [Ignavibacteriae bacterium]|nr:O-antigen ligase family protein [Ignavibacteriota bacterium]
MNIATLLFSSAGILNLFNTPITRSSAIFGDRVFDTDLLVCLMGFSLFLGIDNKFKSKNSNHGIFLLNIIPFVYLVALRTRVGWVALGVIIVVMILFLLLQYRNSIKLNILTIRLGIVVVFSIFLASFIPVNANNERSNLVITASSIFDKNNYSNQARFGFWEASIKMFAENPIHGIGSGKWPGLYPLYNGEYYTDENVDMNSAINPHNDYLEILSEEGIFVFLLFTGLIFLGLYFVFKKSKDNIAYLPFLLSMIGTMIAMFFSFTKDNFLVMLVFSVCMGVGYSSNYQLSNINYEFFKKNKLLLKKLILLVGVLMLSIGLWFKVISFLNEREYIEAMQLKAEGKYVEMLEKLEGVSSFYYPTDMNKMPVDYYRGVGYFELKEYDKAFEKFKNARVYMQYYPTIMNNEAAALYMKKKTKEAEILYLEIKKVFPYYIEPQINLLALYANDNRVEDLMQLGSDIKTKIQKVNKINNYGLFKEIEYKYGF